MSVLVVGLSHRSAPVDVLERVTVSCADAGKVLHPLLEREHVAEALLLSTCNRVEVYAMVTTFHDGLADITDVLAHQSAMTLDELSEHLYVHYAAAGVGHLFFVAAGVAEIVLANRTPGSAQRLAALCEAEGTSARVVGLDGVTAALPTVDLVICCTAATSAVLSIEHVGARRRPLVVCDLGLSRNVEPAVGEVPGVTLLDLTTVARRLEQRGTGSGAVDSAQDLVAWEVRSYLLAQRTAEVIPTVTALRKRAADVVNVELLRLDSRLPGLDSAVRTELTRTVRRVVDKLLHAPTVRVQQLAKARGARPMPTRYESCSNSIRRPLPSSPRRSAARPGLIRPGRTGEQGDAGVNVGVRAAVTAERRQGATSGLWPVRWSWSSGHRGGLAIRASQTPR
jgi:glutamyl-tRNA reductase